MADRDTAKTGAILTIPGMPSAKDGPAGGGGGGGGGLLRTGRNEPDKTLSSTLMGGIIGGGGAFRPKPPVPAKGGAAVPGSPCNTCNPKDPSDPEIWMYRGIQLPRGQAVDGARKGQMASSDPHDAFKYGINPPGARPPAGSDELIVMRFRIRKSQAYDPSVSEGPPPPGTADHLIVNDGIDIKLLPGYSERRYPLSSLAGPRDPERHIRIPNEPAIDAAVPEVKAPGTLGP